MPESAAIWPTFHKRGDAAYVIDVGLQNVDHAHLDELAAAVMRDEPFAGRDGRGGAPRDPRHGGDVLWRAWLFDEEKLQWLDFLDDDRRHARAGLGVEIDADVDVRTEAFAQQLHAA